MTENGDFAQDQRALLARIVREKVPKLSWKIEGWLRETGKKHDSPTYVAQYGDMGGMHGLIKCYEKEGRIYVQAVSVHEAANHIEQATFVGSDADAVFLMARELVVIRESIEMLSKL